MIRIKMTQDKDIFN